MVQIDASIWGDWDDMFLHIRSLVESGLKIKIINGSYLLEIMHGDDLRELGFIK